MMLWHKYPEYLDDLTLAEAYQDLEGDPPSNIPFIVWLIENPASPLRIPGGIDLFGHDCLHLLLKKPFDSNAEAFVVGFTMGSDERTTSTHVLIFKIAARLLYPGMYRLTPAELEAFERGFALARKLKIKNLNQFDWKQWEHKTLQEIRTEIDLKDLEIEPIAEVNEFELSSGDLPYPLSPVRPA